MGLLSVPAILSMPQGSSDPCQPNPCGDNSLCKTNGDAGAIACYCEPGYDQIDPDDPWACVPDGTKGLAGGQASESIDLDTVARTTTTTTRKPSTTTDRPSFLPPKEQIIGKDQFGHTRIFVSAVSSLDTEDEDNDSEATSVDDNSNDVLDISKQPAPAPQPRTPSVGQANKPQGEHRLVGLSVEEIFNAECLINDDCAIDNFCDVTEKVCKDPCVFLENVCGERALCKVKIHRPLCYCPDGLVGNPHAACKPAPSRAGTRF